MATTKDIKNIPVEKFNFAKRDGDIHDKKFDTKPVGYWQDAFRRFCKNKGAVVAAIVIMFLLLFAIIGPFCSPFQVSYSDQRLAVMQPRNQLCVDWGWDFWDGCKVKETGFVGFVEDYAKGKETGKDVIKNGKYTVSEDGGTYTYRYNTYYGTGFGKYKSISVDEYKDIQRYQDETGIQVLYPVVKLSDRPELVQDKERADIYYKTKKKDGQTRPVLDENNEVIPVYWKYSVENGAPATAVEYTSKMRIEGKDGITEDGETYYYVYGRVLAGGQVEVRAEYYEYYIYYHTQVAKDGITEPSFLFGTTSFGKDIFTCISSGARFSFIFAIVVAAVNLFVGAIWGSIAGYFGGKTDLIMERITDVLGAIPSMIVITLLKYHMGSSSHIIVLFLSFFLTGWIGMAGTTRMQFYRYKNQEYVLVARTLGAKDSRIMFKHIFPNAIGTIVTACALVIPAMIYSETNLSYLGIVNLEVGNITSVGTMIAAGQRDMLLAPFVALFPSLFLVLMMLSFNLFGNGLRDAFNPSLRGSEE